MSRSVEHAKIETPTSRAKLKRGKRHYQLKHHIFGRGDLGFVNAKPSTSRDALRLREALGFSGCG
jgi:hypothetical protein